MSSRTPAAMASPRVHEPACGTTKSMDITRGPVGIPDGCMTSSVSGLSWGTTIAGSRPTSSASQKG